MSSSGNFPVWTDLVKGATNITKGGTRFDGSTNSRSAVIPFQVPTGTKFYVECLVTQATNYNIVFGLVNPYQDIATYLESQSTVNGMIFHGYSGGDWRTQALVNGSRQGFNALDDDSTANRVLAMTINRVDNEIKMYIDNTLITNGTISISATEDYTVFASFTGGSASGVHMNINCGHDSTGGGTFSAASNADENGFGEFQHSPPTGFLAICSPNLPTATSIDPSETDDNHPTKNFNALIYSGDATSSNAITGLGLQPDLVWIKERGGTNQYSHSMHDSSRGRARVIFAEDDREEDGSTSTQDLVSFGTDGFTVGTSNESKVNGTGSSFISWNWRCNAGTTATNTSGTITSTVQANQDLGFSIVTWTGTGTASTVGHGLSAAPDCMWVKNRSDDISSDGDANGQNWAVYHSSLGNTKYLSLNTTSNASTSTNWWNNTSPTSSVFTVGTDSSVNESSHAMIAYCWHNVEGFQKFGSYTGNGNSDGPLVYTGFRPRLMMLKMTNGSYSEHWNMWDSVDDSKGILCGNTLDEFHRITEATEATSTSLDVDFLANGFKIRGSNTEMNQSTKTIVYFAWADVPFKYNNAF